MRAATPPAAACPKTGRASLRIPPAVARPAWLDLPPAERAAGTVALPGSKSISNRTLLLAALSAGETRVRGLLDADDVDRMREALAVLGVRMESGGPGELIVHGTAGAIPNDRASLFLGNAGTAFRPLTAALAFARGHYELRGVPRMHERPIGDLVDALRALGAEVRYLDIEGFPPLAIGPGPAPDASIPRRVAVRGDVSSQYVSALLMALPLLTARRGHDVTVEIAGELISRPYVAITTNLMARFGVQVQARDGQEFRVPEAGYASPGTIDVEGDASAASYFLAAGAIGGGPVHVTGVGRRSIQGDVEFADALERMGARVSGGDDWLEASAGESFAGITCDCVAIPDAAMTLAVAALFARGPTTLTGIGSWRVKETDRIAAMATELTKLGARVDAGSDRLTVHPPAGLAPATIDTYDDHRIAMCFSLATLGDIAVRINDPDCVRKTYPGYWDAFRSITRVEAL
jgi:3-phosphoshikimate 1-carboxyvinyltransferase